MKAGEFTKCLICNQGIAHDNQLTFYKLTIDYYCLKPSAIQRVSAMEQYFGGNVRIARVFSDEDVAEKVNPRPMKGLICMDCAIRSDRCIGMLVETINGREAANDNKGHEEHKPQDG